MLLYDADTDDVTDEVTKFTILYDAVIANEAVWAKEAEVTDEVKKYEAVCALST